MRYVKVFLLAVFFFLALIFFFQNQAALSQEMTLTLNLFFLPAMTSIKLPFYFLIIAGFACGALLTLAFLVWDKLNMTAKLMKQRWQIGALQRMVESQEKAAGSAEARARLKEQADRKVAEAQALAEKSA